MRSKCILVLPLLVLLALGAAGADDGSCSPEPEEPVCYDDIDCPDGDMCSRGGRCIPATVSIVTDATWYAPGAPVEFEVNAHRIPIEIDTRAPVRVERWRPEDGGWEPLRTGTLYGCRATGCVDGRPVTLCVDPAPRACAERSHETIEGTWNGRYWRPRYVTCGGTTIELFESVPAPVGNYRLTFRYGRDPHPGYVSAYGDCAPQDELAETAFGIE